MQGVANTADVIQGVIVVTKTTTKKVWTKPTLAPLGTIDDVAAATSTACQNFAGQSGNCQTPS